MIKLKISALKMSTSRIIKFDLILKKNKLENKKLTDEGYFLKFQGNKVTQSEKLTILGNKLS